MNDLSLALTTADDRLLVAAVGNGASVDDAIAPLAMLQLTVVAIAE